VARRKPTPYYCATPPFICQGEKQSATDVVFGYRNPRRIQELAARGEGRVRVVDDVSAYFRPTGEELEPLALYATLKQLLSRGSE